MSTDRARSEVEAANLALSHIREPGITDFDENTHRARVVRKHFGSVRDDLLRSARWNFATYWFTPARDSTDSAGDLAKRYSLPDDCLTVRGVLDLEPDEWKVEGGFTSDPEPAEARFLVTDADAPRIHGTRRIINVSLWDASFLRAFKLALAAAIAPEVARSTSIAKDAAADADAEQDKASIRDAREQAPSRVSRDTDWVRSRSGFRR